MQSDNSRHLNTYIHKILELLKKTEHPISYREILEKIGINILGNIHLVRALKANSRIELAQDTVRFIPAFVIKSEEDLLGIMRAQEGGIEMSRLKDSPFDILPFVLSLEEKGKIIILKDIDNSEIAFYNDMVCPPMKEAIKQLWASIKVPNHHDIVNQLNNAGLKNSEEQTFRKKKAVQGKNKKTKRKIAITNTHVAGLDLNNMEDSD